jgi:5-methyltetrahydrofolate--homocysteine methyltransferase
MLDLAELERAVIEGQAGRACEFAEAALACQIAPADIFQRALSPAMARVGRLMQDGEYFIPEVLASARAMKAAGEVMKPWIVRNGGLESVGRVVIGTVRGDLHDIGKNLVVMMLEGAGFEVVDLGVDVAAGTFAQAVVRVRPQILALSAMLTTTMLQMGPVMQELETAGVRGMVKVIVGGAPVTQQFADEIGADGFGVDAATAPLLARRLLAATAVSHPE